MFHLLFLTIAMMCLSEVRSVMICENNMHKVFSFISGSGYYVRCCESGISGNVCYPAVRGIDYTVLCRDMGFPNQCNCGQMCLGTALKNKTCTGTCTCQC